MKKRILSLLLALLLMMGMMPLALGADTSESYEPEEPQPVSEDTTPTPEPEADPTPTPEPEADPTPTPEPTEEPEPTPTPEPTEAPVDESGNNDATNNTNTDPTPTPQPENDYSGDVGKYLAVASQEYYVSINTGSDFAATDSIVYSGSDLAGLIFCITDWYVDADDSNALWYCVTIAQGEWPEGLADGCWLLQDYLDEDYRSGDSFTFVDAPEQPDEPDEPDEPHCTCGEGDEAYIGNHADDCALYLALVEQYVTAKTAEQLAAEWATLDKTTREMILALWSQCVSEEEYAALVAALPDMTQTVSNVCDGHTVALTGDLPRGVTLSLAPVTESEYHADIYNYVSAEDLVFVLDITPLCADGTAWQPYSGETATVTISVSVADGTRLRLFHNHGGTLRDLTAVTVENGQITFEMDSFSQVYVVTVTTVEKNACDGVVYFDLSAGKVTINANTYTGYRFDGGTTALEVTGKTADVTGGFYVYQSDSSNQTTVGLSGNETNGYTMTLPVYNRVQDWADYITDNTDVASVITAWQTRAVAAGRSATPNNIAISGNVNITVTVDNVWSSYHDRVAHGGAAGYPSSNQRSSGGIQFIPDRTSGGHVTLSFKGDNRFGNIYYTSNSGSNNKTNTNCSLTLNGDDTSTLTVCDFRTSFQGKPGATQNAGDNFWCSVIGSYDGDAQQNLYGLKITNGCVYAGALKEDDCTAIGAGGNGYAQVTISGGTVTAVTTSSGTAIGGGIGKGQAGGAADVTIGGNAKVYAYNFSCDRRNYGGTNAVNYILAAAIGSGSSGKDVVNGSKVTIEGNAYVYARSVGGPAIGGGSTLTQKGGNVKVEIGGNATVDAASIAGAIESFYTSSTVATVPAGVSIGGGNGGVNAGGDGGDCTLTVSGSPTIITGSIGGGKSLSASNKIGSATVNISGGTMQGQVIMASGSGSPCSFTMTGGEIDNTASLNAAAAEGASFVTFGEQKTTKTNSGISYTVDAYTFLSLDGGAVFVQDGNATLSGGTIENVKAKNGGAVAVAGGDFTMSGGTITAAQVTQNGGAVAVTEGNFRLTKGTITGATAANYGGAVYISGGDATLSGGEIKNATALYGGAIGAEGGTVTLSGAALSGCTATKKSDASASDLLPGGYGGAVAMNGGTFTMTAGSIVGFHAATGGGAVYISGGTATLSGGSITGSESTTEAQYGGAVFAKGGSLTLSGATIEKTSASSAGGAVYVEAEGTKTGSVAMSDGKIESVWAANGGAIAATGGSFTMSGGTIEGSIASSNGTATDGNGGAVYVSGGNVIINSGSILGSENEAEAANGGGVYITNGNFTMTGGQMKHFSVSGNGGMVYITGTDSKATIQGGTLSGESGQKQAQNGGAVYVGEGGTFLIEGTGLVENCAAEADGGGVYLVGGSFTIENNGKLNNCSAGGNGGGVYLGENGTFTATGGSMTSCSAGGNGGGLYMVGGTFTMPGATIESCKAANGGGVYLGGGTMNITGGTIQNCTASVNGGGAYVANTTVTFGKTGETITVTGNKAVDGAGFYISNASGQTVTITDGKIESNTASRNGGGLYQTGPGAQCIVSGAGQIDKNTAKNGGGLYIAGGSTLTVWGGHITANNATGTANSLKTAYNSEANVGVGGGVYVAPDSGFTMPEGDVGIYSNTADFAADDLYASPSNTSVTLPAVDGMSLGEGATATGWYGDYATGDNGDKRLISVEQTSLQRYREASKASDVSAYQVDVSKIQSGDYVCLTIGKNNINFGTLTIENQSGAADQYYVFKVKSTALEAPLAGTDIEFEVTVKGSGSVTIAKVPYGSYTVTAVEPWSWRYSTTTESGSATVSATSQAPTVTFTSAIDQSVAYDSARSASLWLDGNSEGVANVFGAAKSAVAALFSRKGGEG